MVKRYGFYWDGSFDCKSDGSFVSVLDYEFVDKQLNVFTSNLQDIRSALIRNFNMYHDLAVTASSCDKSREYYAERDRLDAILKQIEEVQL